MEPKRRTDEAFKRFGRDLVDANASKVVASMNAKICEGGGKSL